ncbi:hypothetical protein V5O39_27800 [Pseudomonas parakoreensis]
MHEALMSLSCASEAEAQVNASWREWLDTLTDSGRACRLKLNPQHSLWLARERLTCLQALYPHATLHPPQEALPGFNEPWTFEDALVEVVRARLGAFGPLPLPAIAEPLALPTAQVAQALARLEREGYVLRGHFTPGEAVEEWCERHLLARIHRYTVKRLRREIEPVALQDFMRFLFDWQHLSAATRGQGHAVLPAIVGQFEGYPAAASAWDSDLLPARLKIIRRAGLMSCVATANWCGRASAPDRKSAARRCAVRRLCCCRAVRSACGVRWPSRRRSVNCRRKRKRFMRR